MYGGAVFKTASNATFHYLYDFRRYSINTPADETPANSHFVKHYLVLSHAKYKPWAKCLFPVMHLRGKAWVPIISSFRLQRLHQPALLQLHTKRC